jgi:NAD(P)-dependent dehydrogenase (short-subunit alcohol dehydrogenase family)
MRRHPACPKERTVEHFDCKDMSALVTGAGSGIGRAIAIGFAKVGASVLATDFNAEALRNLQEDAASERVTLAIHEADVRDQAAVQALVAAAARSAPLDVFVHCAGITVLKTLTETSLREYRDVVETNLSGTFYCLQAVAAQMMEQRRGSIVAISSINAHWPLATQAVYTATKAAIESLCKTLAVEMAPYNVRVNAIAPGAIDTPLNRHLGGEEQRSMLERRIPLGRIGKPQDLVGTVLFLASGGAEYITGSTIVVDGGFMISR